MDSGDSTELVSRSVLESPLIVAVYDKDDVLRVANEAFASRFLRGLPLPVHFSDILRHGHKNGFGVRIDCGDVERFLADILPRRRSVPFRSIQVDTCDGEWILMNETIDARGNLLAIGSDISQLKRQENRLVQAAQRDDLTGIANRRHVLEVAERLLAATRKKGEPLSAVMIDIDHFKRINDRYGHDVGDEVLRQSTRRFKAFLRDADVVGRLGGEEFLVLLPGANAAGADQVIARLRRLSHPPTDPRHWFTFSAGIAEAGAEESLTDLMKRADLALYEAKASGRNRNVIARRAPLESFIRELDRAETG